MLAKAQSFFSRGAEGRATDFADRRGFCLVIFLFQTVARFCRNRVGPRLGKAGPQTFAVLAAWREMKGFSVLGSSFLCPPVPLFLSVPCRRSLHRQVPLTIPSDFASAFDILLFAIRQSAVFVVARESACFIRYSRIAYGPCR